MCPKANRRRVLIHLPHGYVSYATWSIFWISLYPSGINRLVREVLRSRTLGVNSQVGLAARLEQSTWRIERQWGWVARSKRPILPSAHHLEKSAPSFTDTSILYLPQNLGRLALPLVRARHLLQESPRMVHGEQP
jgi:hypothetical protein